MRLLLVMLLALGLSAQSIVYNPFTGKLDRVGGGGDALTTDPLSQFAATTSAQLAGVLSDEVGSGALWFSPKRDLVDAGGFCLDAGSTDTYACSLSPAITAYVTGTHYRFKANTVNTGAASINFNALGAVTIVKVAGGITTALATNDIRAGQWVDLVYDGTNMQMQSLLGNAPAGSGDVVGPASAVDECVPRFDTTTGKLLQDSALCITDAGVATLGGGGTAGGQQIWGNTAGDTAASSHVINSGDGASNTEPGYTIWKSSHATKRTAALFPCTDADGFFCISTAAPVADGTSVIVTAAKDSTVGRVLRTTAANTYAFGALDLADADAVTNKLPVGNAADTLGQAVRSITILTPTTGDTNKVQITFDNAVTILRVWGSTDTGTCTIQFDERAEATPNTAGTDVLTSALVLDATSEATTSFANATIAQYVPMNLQITATASTPGVARIHVAYQK